MENNEHTTWLVPIDIAKELKEIGLMNLVIIMCELVMTI